MGFWPEKVGFWPFLKAKSGHKKPRNHAGFGHLWPLSHFILHYYVKKNLYIVIGKWVAKWPEPKTEVKMIIFEKTLDAPNCDIMRAVIRGMRNPKNSWNKSDTDYILGKTEMGNNDLKLMKTLSEAGTDHSKYLRMMPVYVDITAPLYWWKEFDTYKVGTVANSCSTMHKIHSKEFEMNDFSFDKLNESSLKILDLLISHLNDERQLYLETKDKGHWWQLIQMLPSSYNQKRTVMFNYQVIKHMYESRKNHKLDEWKEFCKWVENLEYFDIL